MKYYIDLSPRSCHQFDGFSTERNVDCRVPSRFRVVITVAASEIAGARHLDENRHLLPGIVSGQWAGRAVGCPVDRLDYAFIHQFLDDLGVEDMRMQCGEVVRPQIADLGDKGQKLARYYHPAGPIPVAA